MYSDYKSFDDGWFKNDTLMFDIQAPDTIKPYDLFLLQE